MVRWDVRAAILPVLVTNLGCFGCFEDPGLLPESASASSEASGPETSSAATGSAGTTSTTTGAPGCYGTDFGAEPRDWAVVSPAFSWVPGDGVYHGTASATPAIARLAGEPWLGVRADVRLRFAEDGHAGVILRATELPGGSFLYVEASAGGVRGFQDGFEGSSFTIGTALTAGAWHTLTVELMGDAVRVEFDGQQMISGLPLPGHPAGSVALVVSAGSADFDTLSLCPV